MKIITFGAAAILAAVVTTVIVARPSLAEIEACCNTQAQKTKVEHYVKAEPTGEAATVMARHYTKAATGPGDEAQALFWYRHAAHKGFPAAIAHIGAFTANAAVKPCFDAQAAAEARELLGSEKLQSPQWNNHVSRWLTALQTASVSTAPCGPNSTLATNTIPTASLLMASK